MVTGDQPFTRGQQTFLILPRMKAGLSEKRGVSPEQAIKTLRQHGIEVNEKQAEEILDFMYFLAKQIVNQNFEEQRE